MKLRTVTALLLSMSVAACGSSGSSDNSQSNGGTDAGSPASIFAQGPISGFGSVIVNGVRYDTVNAQFSVDDEIGSESDLKVGQIVTIFGSIDDDGMNGTATEVVFDDAVEGPIQSIDLPNDSMVVLGQTVLITADTAFDDDISPASLEGLTVDDTVEVSGYFDADGNIVASYIELEDGNDEYEVSGIVTNLDTTNFTFELNALVVDFSNATLEDFPNGNIEEGQPVEAEGMMLGVNGELIATEVEYEGDDLDANDGDEAEVEGLITRFVSASDFDVNGIPVTTTNSTEFENGSAADLALNVHVEVEGDFDSNGVIIAEEIEFEQEGILRLAGLVESIGGDQLTVLGVTVTVNSSTEIEDDSEIDLPNFSFDDLNVNDYVEVRGFDQDGFVATRLERDDDTGEAEVRGFVESVSDPDFSILGVTISTDANTEFEIDDVVIDSSEFFAQADGALVEAEGVYANGVLAADEVELENDDD